VLKWLVLEWLVWFGCVRVGLLESTLLRAVRRRVEDWLEWKKWRPLLLIMTCEKRSLLSAELEVTVVVECFKEFEQWFL